MSTNPTPRQILATLLPHLKVAAAYAHQIQSQIAVHPAKEEGENFFAAALTDADLAVQNFVEVALLGSFPQIRFHGEEYEQSSNTKYFRATDLGEEGDYLVTLDPIDGTQFYLDGHSNYQTILGVLNWDDFEAAIALSPAQNTYFYALRGQGAYQGSLEDSLEACRSLKIKAPKAQILLGWGTESLKPELREHYKVIDIKTSYSHDVEITNFNGIFSNELSGAIIKSGKFIDGAALAFIAREAGWIVTTFDGSPLPPLHICKKLSQPEIIVAASASVHQHLLEAAQNL